MSEQRREIGNDVVNKIRHTINRFENRMTLDNPRFVERYLEMDAILLIQFTVGPPMTEWVAYLQRKIFDGHECTTDASTDRDREWFGTVTSGPYRPHHFQVLGTHVTKSIAACRDQQTVLVDNVKFVQVPERVIPTFVWFDRPDRLYSVLPRALYFSLNGRFEFRGSIDNGKGDLRKRSRLSGSDAYELICQMIESAADVTDGVACDDRYAQGNRITNAKVADALSGLRIVLDSSSVWVGCEKTCDLTLEIKDVLIGPLNL